MHVGPLMYFSLGPGLMGPKSLGPLGPPWCCFWSVWHKFFMLNGYSFTQNILSGQIFFVTGDHRSNFRPKTHIFESIFSKNALKKAWKQHLKRGGGTIKKMKIFSRARAPRIRYTLFGHFWVLYTRHKTFFTKLSSNRLQKKRSHFCLFLKVFHRFTPLENARFLLIFENFS